MSAATRMKDKEMASYMKSKGITRTTGKCPRSCGSTIENGGPALISHLNVCQGRRKVGAKVVGR